MTPRQLSYYRATTYQMGGALVRIGKRSALVDSALRYMHSPTAVIVGAWNPGGRKRPSGWNVRMHMRLVEVTRRLFTVPGGGELGAWHEAHLMLRADPRRGIVVARRFRQNAVVVVRRGAPARLVLLRPATPPASPR